MTTRRRTVRWIAGALALVCAATMGMAAYAQTSISPDHTKELTPPKPGARLAGSATPTTVVARLYKDFAWEALGPTDEAFGKPLVEQPRNVLERYFDGTLASLLVNDDACIRRNRGADCNLGFTPIFASNDPEASDLDITPLSGDRVAVSFTYPGNGEKIGLEYLTVRTPNGWRIKDIVYHNMNDEHLARILSRKP